MAEDKTSFVLYCDLLHTVGHLTDEQAGKLFKHILNYVNDKNQKTNDVITTLSFEPIKQQLKRDLKKWDNRKLQKSKAGKKGMAKRWGSKPPITQLSSVIPPITNITDNVTVNVNVNVIELSEIEIGATIQFCSFSLNRKYDKARIVELWQAFLINGQEKNYTGREKKIKHFRNWIKTQPEINGTHQQPNRQGIKSRTGKSAGANNLLEIVRKDYERPG